MVVEVDYRPLKTLAQRGEGLPSVTVMGSLPVDYDPEEYVAKAQPLLNNRQRVDLRAAEHAAFAVWFEQHTAPTDRNLRYYTLALSGLGLLPEEQREQLRCRDLSEGAARVIGSRRYYPKTLPLWMVELVYRILEVEGQLQMRQWRRVWIRTCRVLALPWHAWRLDYYRESSPGRFSYSYIEQWTGCRNTDGIAQSLEWLEKYSILECIDHETKANAGKNTKINRFRPQATTLFQPGPLVILEDQEEERTSRAGGIECFLSSTYRVPVERLPRYAIGDRLDEILPAQTGSFIPDAWSRRVARMKAFWSGRPSSALVLAGSWAEIERATQILGRRAKTIPLNHAYLDQRIEQLRAQLEQVANAKERLATRSALRLCETLRCDGVSGDYMYTRTGRLKSHAVANPLCTSMRADRRGYDFWAAHDLPLWTIDIAGADPLFAAILADDAVLFEDAVAGDIYAMAAEPLGLDAEHHRDLLKRLFLALMYGASLGCDEVRPRGLFGIISRSGLPGDAALARAFRDWCRARYSAFWDWAQRMRARAYAAYRERYRLRLPNELRVPVEPGREHAAMALHVQALVKIAVTRLLLELHAGGVDILYEIHDCVVVSGPVEPATVPFRPVVLDLLRELGRPWTLPDVWQGVTVKSICTSGSMVFPSDLGNSEVHHSMVA